MQKDEIKKLKIELFVTRHGQTDHNKTKTLCGQNPGKLTELGKKQAQKIGDHFKNAHFDRIYVSDLGRTKETFEHIKLKAPQMSKIDTKYTALLRQKSSGILTGKPLGAWQKQAQKQKKSIRQYRCKDGESWVDVNKRVHKFLETLINENRVEGNKKILVVCHGGYIMQLHNVCREIESRGKEKAVFDNSAKNCSIHLDQQQFNQMKMNIKCTINNFTKHMDTQ